MNPVKPGYQSSEFWFMLLAQVVAILVLSGVFAPGSTIAKIVAVVGSILASMGYTAARTTLKGKDSGSGAV